MSKVKKENIVIVTNAINTLEYIISQVEVAKWKLNESLSYCFMRNNIKMKKIMEEHAGIIKFIREGFEKKEKIDKEKLEKDSDYKAEYDKNLNKLFEEDKKLKDFLEEETEFSFYKIKMDKLEGAIVPSNYIVTLSDHIFED